MTPDATAQPFWISSGFDLLVRDDDGWLAIGDDFLRAYFNRPEMRPVEESCDNERQLHRALVDDPRHIVTKARLAMLADPDAIENYQVVLGFRDLLMNAGTAEAAYLRIARGEAPAMPPLFADQLAHAILRNILDGSRHAFEARAAELFFRSQRVTIRDGQIMLADDEIVDMHARTAGFGDLGRLIVEAGGTPRQVDLDVLSDNNSADYWPRSDRFDMVLDLTFTRPGLDALCRVMEKWIAHFLRIETRIQPLQSIADEHWIWHSGLDAASSQLLNDLYQGKDVAEDQLSRLLCLFRLDIKDPAVMLPRTAGHPAYLGLAMSADNLVRMKPQNLLVNLPLKSAN